MEKIACVGDKVVGICDHGSDCCPHTVTGEFIEGSEKAAINGRKIVRKGDHCRTNCPHCGDGVADEGSETIFCEGKPVHIIGQRVKLGGGWGRSEEGFGTAYSKK